jgi:ABC-2 type transport system permease protein
MPGVLEQLKLVAGLRWSILKNSFRCKNSRWDLIGMIWAAVFGGLLVAGTCFAFFAGAYEFLSGNRVGWMAALFWGIFVWWQVFPILVAGFGANFEFKTLLRFPLSLRAFYLLGLGYGLADFAAVSSVCWIVAMVIGVAAERRAVLPVMLMVSGLFVVLNVTLERLVGSWVEKILVKRKTRELFIGLFILSMVSLNFLNPAFQRWGDGTAPKFIRLWPYLGWLPASLAGSAVAGAAGADRRSAMLGVAGLLVWLGVTSALLWRRFAAQYAGEEMSESARPAIVVKKRERRQISFGDGPGFVPGPVAAVTLKEFRYLTRNGIAFLTLVVPPIMVCFFSLQFAGVNSMLGKRGLSAEMFFPGMMAYLILILLTPAYNSFAYENKGIQTYFVAPVRFRDVLLGKNLFLVGLVSLELALSLALLVWRIGWPSAPMFAATVAAAAFAVMGQLTIANWSSLSFPKRMEIGRMKGQRNSGIAVWTAFGVQIVLGGICAAVLIAGKWLGNPWTPAIAFAALTAAAAGGYVASLEAMNRLAEEKKELLIETLCR